jgi:hypothetical protein
MATDKTQILTLNRLLLLLAMLVVSGCAGPKFQQDYRPDSSFTNLKTYTWRQVSTEVPGTDSHQLQHMADAHLLANGFAQNNETPDMVLDMTVVTRVSTGSSTGIGLSIGLPIGQHGSIGLGGGKSVPNDKFEGVILLDITESKNNDLLWRGSAEGIPLKNFDLKNQTRLDLVLGKLIKQFPPH